jgi:hypothetical protein
LREPSGGVSAIDYGAKLAFALLKSDNALINCVFGHQSMHKHGPLLTHAVRATGCLVLYRGVPPGIHQKYVISGSQIQTGATGLQRCQQHWRPIFFLKSGNYAFAIARASVEARIADGLLVKPGLNQRQQAGPLRKYDCAMTLGDDFLKRIRKSDRKSVV